MNRILWWDEVVYLSLGNSILKGKYEIAPNRDTFRPALFPFLIALSFLTDGENLIRILVAVFSIFSIISTYYMGKKLFDVKTGLLAALIMLSFPLFIFYSNKILAEMVFLTFTPLAVTTFYFGIEKDNKFLYMSAFLTGISILTKYFGFYLLIIYFLYVLFKKEFRIFKKRKFYIVLIIFFLTLTPWLIINTIYYRNPIGGIFENAEIYLPLEKNHPFYFFIANSWEIFGLSAILIPVGIFYAIKERKNNSLLILIYALIPFVIFSLTNHKESRYLVAFFPSFACLIAFAIQKIPKGIRNFVYGFLVFTLIVGLYLGCKSIAEEEVSLDVLKEGSMYVKNITHTNEYVMSESYPYLSYYTDRMTIRPPKDKGEFYNLLANYNISYILVDISEPGNPNYLLSELRIEKFKEIKSFTNQNQRTVKIYKKL
jgi:4-amino-4-deoxy-L-arabinose transferase-like glycosyltransferase